MSADRVARGDAFETLHIGSNELKKKAASLIKLQRQESNWQKTPPPLYLCAVEGMVQKHLQQEDLQTTEQHLPQSRTAVWHFQIVSIIYKYTDKKKKPTVKYQILNESSVQIICSVVLSLKGKNTASISHTVHEWDTAETK